MEYPEEIYATRNGGTLASKDMQVNGSSWGRRHAYNIGCARGYQSGYEAGKAKQSDPSTHYSNLTSAIRDNDPIDWERLDGLNVKCVNPDMGMLSGKLERNPACLPDVCGAWWDASMGYAYINALVDAWYGSKGWALYVEGEIPLRRKTADELEVGRFFTGKLSCTVRENLMCVADEYGRGKHVRFAADFSPSRYPATEWVVIEEHGTFQKPEGK